MQIRIGIIVIASLFSFRIFAQSSDVNTLPPLDELGTDKYKGYLGGLYPEGRNIMPASFFSDAVLASQNVLPRDKQGNPDANGKIGLITIGASTVAMFSSALENLIYDVPDIHPSIVFINGGVGAQDLNKIYDQQAKYWQTVESRVAEAGITNAQVQVAWLQEDDLRNQSSDFPGRPRMLVDSFADLIRKLKTRYPNLQIIYLTARHTTEYMPAESSDKHKEPRAYLNGWAMKWLIEDQINGKSNLNYKGENAVAPLLMWGPYFWTQGDKPRNDGYTFTPEMVNNDGVHPNETGKIKVAKDLLGFWQNDPVSQIWFYGKAMATNNVEYLSLFANGIALDKIPALQNKVDVQVLVTHDTLLIYNSIFSGMHSGRIDIENIPIGDYKYLWLAGETMLGSGSFSISQTQDNDTTGEIIPDKKNNVTTDQPALLINGADKLTKIKRTVGGDPERFIVAIFSDRNGDKVLTIEDVLHKQSNLNDLLPQGAYVLKLYEVSGKEVEYMKEIPETIKIK